MWKDEKKVAKTLNLRNLRKTSPTWGKSQIKSNNL